jgi:predicted esterase YcpF (UPF0227 family)
MATLSAQSLRDDDASEVLERSAALAVRYVAGTGEKLVISFRGLGSQRGGGGRTEEFWGSIRQDGRNHLLFIADVAQSWYNTRGMIQRIRDHVSEVIARVKPRQISAIGNSMGGYGAIVFSRFFPFDQVLSICPQATLNQNIVPDRRWARYARAVRAMRAPHVRDCVNPTTRYTVLLGARGLERIQTVQMPTQDNVRVFQMQGYYHAVAEGLKEQGLLRPMVHSFLNAEAFGLERQITAAGGVPYKPKPTPEVLP